METHFNWVECFDPTQQSCRLLPGCGLKQLLARAGNSYLQVLDASTLADMLPNTVHLKRTAEKNAPEYTLKNKE
jgi:Rrf2 family nitric oxide-sensitive transcriptional repressor